MPGLLFSSLRPYRPQWLRGDLEQRRIDVMVVGDGGGPRNGAPDGANRGQTTGRATVRPDELEGEKE